MNVFRDKDQDRDSRRNTAQRLSGGWWYSRSGDLSPTGQHTKTRHKSHGSDKYIQYYYNGRQGRDGTPWDSWAEAEFLLVPN